MTVQFNENLPSCEYQSDSMIQRASGETRGQRSKANSDRRS